MRCLETLLGLALLALGVNSAWDSSCEPCSCHLDRGLRTAECLNTALTSVPVFSADTQRISIREGNNIASLLGGEFDGYKNLTHISLRQNPLTELPRGIFSKTKNVIEIDLYNNKIKILQSHLFSNLIYLQYVWLRENQISILEDNCFYNVPQLIEVNLYSNQLSKINQNFINDYSTLEILHLYDNPVVCDDSICELMNRVVQRKLYVEEYWMPRCAGPPSVQGLTWAEAVGVLWGAGIERCPGRATESYAPSTTGPPVLLPEPKDAKLQLFMTEPYARSTAGPPVLLLAPKDAELQLLMAEMEKTRREVAKELRQTQEAFKEEMHKARSEARSELQLLQQELMQTRHMQNAAITLLMEEINKIKIELQHVKGDLHSGHLALKEEMHLLLEQTKQALQDKGAVNILLNKVFHSRNSEQGVLVLRYSMLPSPNTSLPAHQTPHHGSTPT